MYLKNTKQISGKLEVKTTWGFFSLVVFFASTAALNHKEKLTCIYKEGNQVGVSSNAISIVLCIINGMIK